MTKRVSMKDIASALNLSVDAVSKALRNSPRISEATKKIVHEKAVELGYIKNSFASSLKSGSSNFVAVYINSLLNPYFAVMTMKLMNKLKEQGYTGILCFTDTHQLDVNHLSYVFHNNCSSVISLVEPTDESVVFLKKNEIPFYLLGIPSKNKWVNYIVSNDFHGGELAGQYFLKHNYKKALYVTDSLSGTSILRKNGFLKALEKYDQSSIFVLETTPEMDVSSEITKLVKNNNIDFIFAFSDYFANKVRHWLMKKGVEWSNNIKVVGYDSINSYFPVYEDSTSIFYDMDEICSEIINDLREFLKSPANHKLFRKVMDVKVCEEENFYE